MCLLLFVFPSALCLPGCLCSCWIAPPPLRFCLKELSLAGSGVARASGERVVTRPISVNFLTTNNDLRSNPAGDLWLPTAAAGQNYTVCTSRRVMVKTDRRWRWTRRTFHCKQPKVFALGWQDHRKNNLYQQTYLTPPQNTGHLHCGEAFRNTLKGIWQNID